MVFCHNKNLSPKCFFPFQIFFNFLETKKEGHLRHLTNFLFAITIFRVPRFFPIKSRRIQNPKPQKSQGFCCDRESDGDHKELVLFHSGDGRRCLHSPKLRRSEHQDARRYSPFHGQADGGEVPQAQEERRRLGSPTDGRRFRPRFQFWEILIFVFSRSKKFYSRKCYNL